MREVSSRIYRAVFEGVCSLGVSGEELDSIRAYVADLGAWTTWEEWIKFVDRIERLTRDRGGLRRVGECYTDVPALAALRHVFSVFATPKLLFGIGARVIGQSLFPHVRCETEELGDDRLVQTLTIPSSATDSPGFFELMLGALIVSPRYIYLPPAHVEMRVQPRRAVYTIVPPPPMTFATRVARCLRMVFSGSDYKSVKVFTQLVSTLHEGNRELERQRALIEARAEALERALRERDDLLAENERTTHQLRKAREELEYVIEEGEDDPLVARLRTLSLRPSDREVLVRFAEFVETIDDEP